MNPLYAERVQQYLLTELFDKDPIGGSKVITSRTKSTKQLIALPVREEHLCKYWAIWKGALTILVTMASQRLYGNVPELAPKQVNESTRNILEVDKAYLVATEPRYVEDVIEVCFKYVEAKQQDLSVDTDPGHLRLLQSIIGDLLCIENRYLVRVLPTITDFQPQMISAMNFQQHYPTSYDIVEIKELCDRLRHLWDTTNQLIRSL